MHLCSAASVGHLMARARLRDEHRGFQIDANDLVELLFTDVGEQLLALNPHAIDQQVKPSVLFPRAVDGATHGLDAFRVGDEGIGAQAGVANRSG